MQRNSLPHRVKKTILPTFFENFRYVSFGPKYKYLSCWKYFPLLYTSLVLYTCSPNFLKDIFACFYSTHTLVTFLLVLSSYCKPGCVILRKQRCSKFLDEVVRGKKDRGLFLRLSLFFLLFFVAILRKAFVNLRIDSNDHFFSLVGIYNIHHTWKSI